MNAPRWLAPVARTILLLLIGGLFLGLSTSNRGQVFVDGRVYFVDADCYSRMTRVAQVLKSPFTRIAHHQFENFPEGTSPHTTAPMDWAIAALAAALSTFTTQPLDLAGAWISPLLGLVTLALLAVWGARMPFREAMLLLFAVSPMIVQGFKLGRPDHQSLLLFLLAAALAAEHSMWKPGRQRTAILWGLAWGVALWTSLYEPLVLLALTTVTRLAVLRKSAFTKAWAIAHVTLLGVLAIAILFDGWRVGPQDPIVGEYFARWAKSIGELASVPPLSAQFFTWAGWLVLPLPALIGWRWLRKRDVSAALPLALVVATYALTCWQLRWGSYFALTVAMAMPLGLAAIPRTGVAWTAFVISLLPIAPACDAALFPNESRRAALEEIRTDYQLLRQLSDALVSNESTPILAPWWLSPPIAYWSGQPCIAGSSHQSLPGTVDTARFYMTTDSTVAHGILERRGVRYVVAYEPSRVLGTAAPLLGENPRPRSMADILYSAPTLAPNFLKLVFANSFFRVYEFRPDASRTDQ